MDVKGNEEFNFAFAHFCIRRNNDNRGRIDAFASKIAPFHPRPNSFGRSRYPNPHRNHKIRNPHNWTRAFFPFFPFESPLLPLL